MTESKGSEIGADYKNLPLDLVRSQVETVAELPVDSVSVIPQIRPKTPEEHAVDTYNSQGHITKRLPLSQRPLLAGREPVVQDFKSTHEIEANLADGWPASFSPLPIPDGRSARDRDRRSPKGRRK